MTDETRGDASGDDEIPETPPLPKVDLPEINRAPADRSRDGYLAKTPGIGDEQEPGPDDATSRTPAAGESGHDEATSRTPAAGESDGDEATSRTPTEQAAAERAEAELAAARDEAAKRKRRGSLGAMWTGIALAIVAGGAALWMALNGYFG